MVDVDRGFAELAGYHVGDYVRLPCLDVPFEVIGFDGTSMLVLRAPSGRELKAGWRACRRHEATCRQ